MKRNSKGRFIKGESPWNKGKSMVHDGSFKKNHSVHISWRMKMSKAKEGKTPWIKGKSHSTKSKELI